MRRWSSTVTRSSILYPDASNVTTTAAAKTTVIAKASTGTSHHGGLVLRAIATRAAKTSQKVTQAPVGPRVPRTDIYRERLSCDKAAIA